LFSLKRKNLENHTNTDVDHNHTEIAENKAQKSNSKPKGSLLSLLSSLAISQMMMIPCMTTREKMVEKMKQTGGIWGDLKANHLLHGCHKVGS
jgi:hypothetical protein